MGVGRWKRYFDSMQLMSLKTLDIFRNKCPLLNCFWIFVKCPWNTCDKNNNIKFRKYFQIRETIGKSTHFVLNKSVNNMGCTKVVIFSSGIYSSSTYLIGNDEMKIAINQQCCAQKHYWRFYTFKAFVVINTDQSSFD